jgi:hypothetical protein
MVVLPALFLPLGLVLFLLAMERIETALLGPHPALDEDMTHQGLDAAATTPAIRPGSSSTAGRAPHRRRPALDDSHLPAGRRARFAAAAAGGPMSNRAGRGCATRPQLGSPAWDRTTPLRGRVGIRDRS